MASDVVTDLDGLRMAARIAGVVVADLSLPEDQHFVGRGLRLHYLDWGTAGRFPVLFLHGGLLTAHTWDLTCAPLRAAYHCVALDQRGHGDSEWSAGLDYSAAAYLGDIEAWVEHLELDRFVLVGQSLGALNALRFAQVHSDRLAGLVIVDLGFSSPRSAGARRIRDFAMLPAELGSIDEFVDRAVAFNPLRHPQLLRRSLRNNLRCLPNGRWTWKYDRRHLTDTFAEMPAHLDEVRSRLAEVRCPALVVRGESSDVVTASDAAALVAALPLGRFAEVEGAGHTVQGDNPRALVEVLRCFLDDVCRRGAPRAGRGRA
jgi:pimeloyl-ACP methyl ester carboxylesterase